MRRLLSTLLRGWADAALRSRLADLETQLASASAKAVILEAERDTMAAVMARDRLRVQAETAAHARVIAGEK